MALLVGREKPPLQASGVACAKAQSQGKTGVIGMGVHSLEKWGVLGMRWERMLGDQAAWA